MYIGDEELLNKISELYVDKTKQTDIEKFEEMKKDLDYYITLLNTERNNIRSDESLSEDDKLKCLNGVDRVVLNTFMQNFELRFKNNPYYTLNKQSII